MSTLAHSRRRVPITRAPQYLLRDVDRCTVDSDNHLEHVYAAASACGLDDEPLRSLAAVTVGDGGSFQATPAVKGLISRQLRRQGKMRSGAHAFSLSPRLAWRNAKTAVPQLLEEFYQAYDTVDGPPLLYDDVPDFQVRTASLPQGDLTYTRDPPTQLRKVRKAGLRGSLIMMPHSDKGSFIASLRNTEGGFDVPHYNEDGTLQRIYRVGSICLIDDKITSFGPNFPADCTGFVIQRGEERLPSQKGEIALHLRNQIGIVEGLGSLGVIGGYLQDLTAHAQVA